MNVEAFKRETEKRCRSDGLVRLYRVCALIREDHFE